MCNWVMLTAEIPLGIKRRAFLVISALPDIVGIFAFILKQAGVVFAWPRSGSLKICSVYVTLKTWAESLGETAQEDVLQSILKQEKQADVLLTGIARRVNITAGSSAYAGVR